MIREEGFQTGWKRITGRPQHGNNNPNWKDQQRFLLHAIARGIQETADCPDLPFLRREVDRRSQFSRQAFWYHCLQAVKLYDKMAKTDRACKRKGLFSLAYTDVGCEPPELDELPKQQDELT